MSDSLWLIKQDLHYTYLLAFVLAFETCLVNVFIFDSDGNKCSLGSLTYILAMLPDQKMWAASKVIIW